MIALLVSYFFSKNPFFFYCFVAMGIFTYSHIFKTEFCFFNSHHLKSQFHNQNILLIKLVWTLHDQLFRIPIDIKEKMNEDNK